jgi:hypothetical protein
MHNTMIRLDLNLARQSLAPRTGIRRALHARISKRRDEFADIDIHATAITHPGLSQWRGVQGKHGNALHHL